ncbi:hypothetical protein HIM_08141 [Hirsutella minnesotensis 3608]|uniref:Aminoglycoside phosphotransferase domain-containing protein n=1 Tax=Hirsutella minnesotensis 3608 TaxID=1043627 RepID=A0A0F7ZYH3_9HYPO|nr:hypothetical protein HIM_08141 [Hirsutella minnesotensis 3608]
MEETLPLLRGRISLEDALAEDVDIARELSWPGRRYWFWLELYARRDDMAHVVSRHLGLRLSDFALGGVEKWIHGSFNACVPVHVAAGAAARTGLPRRALLRFPLPYKVGDDVCPGNADEKLRSEAATYLWLQQNCPDVPVPRLLGFGFPGKRSFTAVQHESLLNRIIWSLRHVVSRMFGRRTCPYVAHDRSHLHDLGYLVLEHVEAGEMLSSSWEEHRGDARRRGNLFRGLSRIMLRLASVPLPRIGSWSMDDDGNLIFTNRPLTLLLHQLENAEIPTEMPRESTYSSVEPYILDLLTCQDNRIRHQPNSIHHQQDGESQLAALTAMRALLPRLTDKRLRHGPFVFTLTDLHQSNIFVDPDWNITSIIDLEWACSRPVEMLGPPEWLSGRRLDELAFHYDEFRSLHDEFVAAVETEERAQGSTGAAAERMRVSWRTGSYWYFRALDSPTTLLALVIDHILPRFAELSCTAQQEFGRTLAPLWDVDTPRFISSKVREDGLYRQRLRDLYAQSAAEPSDSE